MELLLMVHDRIGADLFKDTKLFKRGMIVDACPDGFDWGYEELTNPTFRIVRASDIQPSEADSFLSAEIGFLNVPFDQSTLQIRAFKLNIDAPSIPAGVAAWLADDTRAQPIWATDTTFSGKQLLALSAAMPAVPNPLVLGADGTVL